MSFKIEYNASVYLSYEDDYIEVQIKNIRENFHKDAKKLTRLEQEFQNLTRFYNPNPGGHFDKSGE